ncbi:MAG: hypothetical protein JSS79_05170 [Bacteroidetes bacterium]|nr:hypothetical protein [Bacteroidota bacterium]
MNHLDKNGIDVDALFSDAPVVKKNFPEPIWCEGSNGKPDNGRFIVTIKLKPTLIEHVKDGRISFTVLKRKKVGEFGATHAICVNQNEWPEVKQVNSIFLTIAKVENEHATSFTLTTAQLNSLAYTPKGGTGKSIKLEFVDNGLQVGVFRYLQDTPKEATGFKAAQKILSVQNAGGSYESSFEDKLANTLKNVATLTAQNSANVANQAVDDFLSGL